MDTLTNHHGIIACVLEAYRELYAQSEEEEVDSTVIQDDTYGEYLLMRVGWRGEKRVDKPVFYLRLKNGKIHIEEDWTEEGIVLAFNPSLVRHLTAYSVK